MSTDIYGASVSGKPHLVPLTTWPTDHHRLVLARCGRLTHREVPEPSPNELCGNCRLLRDNDKRHQQTSQRESDRHLEPARQRIADEIIRIRDETPSGHKAERSATVTGLLIALAIALGAPGDLHAADLYIQQRPSI